VGRKQAACLAHESREGPPGLILERQDAIVAIQGDDSPPQPGLSAVPEGPSRLSGEGVQRHIGEDQDELVRHTGRGEDQEGVVAVPPLWYLRLRATGNQPGRTRSAFVRMKAPLGRSTGSASLLPNGVNLARKEGELSMERLGGNSWRIEKIPSAERS
jgi:hypothetical protein